MSCDNQTAICIVNNPVLHERTKHIEVNFHFVWNTVLDGLITTSFTSSSTQFADVCTKTMFIGQY